MAKQDLPGWPLWLDQATTCRFLSLTRGQLNAMQAAGTVPPPKEVHQGVERWSRRELERLDDRLFEGKQEPDLEEDKRRARQAIEDWRAARNEAKPKGGR